MPSVKDRRAVAVAITGIVAVLAVVLLVVCNLPGDVPAGQTNTKGQSAVTIGSAGLTAIATIVGAYFGIKVANVAREDSNVQSEKAQLRIASLAGALPEGSASEALDRAERFIDKRTAT